MFYPPHHAEGSISCTTVGPFTVSSDAASASRARAKTQTSLLTLTSHLLIWSNDKQPITK